MAITYRILPNEIGVGVLENGNAGIMCTDKAANTAVIIELDPPSWKAFLENAPRLVGVGIPIVGRAGLVIADEMPPPNGGG